MPGFAELVSDGAKLAAEGIHGGVDLGPVHLEVGSSVLVIAPPQFAGGGGPSDAGRHRSVRRRPGRRHARVATRRRHAWRRFARAAARNDSYGGTLELPLGPVQISATAVVAVIDGEPSFLAIMGAAFLPPIQLSFGFSLDRVGGIVGVNRRADTDALREAQRTGTAGDVLFAIKPPAVTARARQRRESPVPVQSRHASRRAVAETRRGSRSDRRAA